jgi:hypothetical protein
MHGEPNARGLCPYCNLQVAEPLPRHQRRYSRSRRPRVDVLDEQLSPRQRVAADRHRLARSLDGLDDD